MGDFGRGVGFVAVSGDDRSVLDSAAQLAGVDRSVIALVDWNSPCDVFPQNIIFSQVPRCNPFPYLR